MANTRFLPPAFFEGAEIYRLMPFRFERLKSDNILLTSDAGEFAILSQKSFEKFIEKSLPHDSRDYLLLKSRSFLIDEFGPAVERVAASQWRTKKAFMEGGPKLHIFVPTLRCNQSCGYCQASRADCRTEGVDMSEGTAFRAIDLMLSSPASAITMEFQGGEPLLAFDLVKRMTRRASERAAALGKQIRFVICTNLTLLNDEHLAYFQEYNVSVSTSIDGPPDIHNRNRPLNGAGTYDKVVANISRCHEVLGRGSVSALMTTTLHSLKSGRKIVDEYVRIGLNSIFLRELNPYGFAAKSAKAIGYGTDEFVAFYRDTLNYIITLNECGTFFSEGYAATLLQKMLTPFGVGFVDLQSPTGEGFGVILYNYDGGVYASDEARMLAEMGDQTFKMGDVEDDWTALFNSDSMKLLAAAGVAEALPGCCDCAFVPFCGADPIRHYRTQADLIGHRPTSSFCRKQKEIFRTLFELVDTASPDRLNVLLGWINPSRRLLPDVPWLS